MQKVDEYKNNRGYIILCLCWIVFYQPYMIYTSHHGSLYQKRFYTRRTFRGINISRLDKIPILYRGWPRSLIYKSVNYLSCIEGKGSLKDIQCSAQNAALFVDLL